MVNTLRITSIVAGILAVALLSFSTVFGIQKDVDPEVVALLQTPSARDVFKKTHGEQQPVAKNQKPSLVVEAEKYTAVPPTPRPKTEPRQIAGRPPVPRKPPTPVTAKFDLLATSFFPADPNQSCAMVKETGGHYRWLNIGDSIGHQVVKDIQDGKLILQQANGAATETLEMPQRATQHLLAGVDYPDEPKEVSPAAGIAPHLTPGQPLDPIKVQPTPSAAQRIRRAVNNHYRQQGIRQRQVLTPDNLQQLRDMQKELAELKEKDMGQSPEVQEQNAKAREKIMQMMKDRINAQHMQPGEIAPDEEAPDELDPNLLNR